MNSYIDGVRDALSRAGLVRSSGSGWVAGFALGAGVGLVSGAVVALLLTPTNGPEMRREISWRAKKLAERTQGALQDVTENVKGTLSDVKQNMKGKLAEAENNKGRHEVPIG
jgi:gas vesicle protein